MAAHRVPHDRLARQVRVFQARRHDFGQLARDVAPHAVVGGERGLRGVDVEAGAQPEVPRALGIVRHAVPSRAGVRRDEHEAQLGRDALGARLVDEVRLCARQAGEPPHHGKRPFTRRVEDCEAHRRLRLDGGVAIHGLHAAEGPRRRHPLHRRALSVHPRSPARGVEHDRCGPVHPVALVADLPGAYLSALQGGAAAEIRRTAPS